MREGSPERISLRKALVHRRVVPVRVGYMAGAPVSGVSDRLRQTPRQTAICKRIAKLCSMQKYGLYIQQKCATIYAGMIQRSFR